MEEDKRRIKWIRGGGQSGGEDDKVDKGRIKWRRGG